MKITSKRDTQAIPGGDGPAMTPERVAQMLDEHFPELREEIGELEIRRCSDGKAEVRLAFETRFKRPGGTISGPTMFKLADVASYIAIIGTIGDKGIDSVTTTMTINFLSRPLPDDLVCRMDILRLGRRQVVCEGRIYSGETEKLVAQASCIYALPMA